MSLPQVTATELLTWDLCPQRHFWRYRAGKHGCGLGIDKRPVNMELGLYVHAMLELYVTKGLITETSGAEWAAAQDLEPLPFKEANRVLLAYVRKYPLEPKLKVIAAEKVFSFERIEPIGEPCGAEMVGKLDLCYEDTDGNLILRENKYWSPRAEIPQLLPIQIVIYALAIQSLTKLWPSAIEWNILYHPIIRPKQAEDDVAFLDRVEAEAAFHRQLVAISPEQILASWRHQVAPKVLMMAGTLPYAVTSACHWYYRPCEYLPLCEAKLQGRDPSEQELNQYRNKEVKHEELR